MIGTDKERHRAVEVADPDLVGAGVEVERALFCNLGRGVRRGKDFDADFRRAGQKARLKVKFGPGGIQPCDVERLHAVGGRNRALGQRLAVGQTLVEEAYDSVLAARMTEAGWGSHEDVSMTIRLNTIGQFGQTRVCAEFGPTSQVKAGL